MKRVSAIISLILTLIALTACGGGGDGGGNQVQVPPPSAPPPQQTANWDELIWDQDNWE